MNYAVWGGGKDCKEIYMDKILLKSTATGRIYYFLTFWPKDASNTIKPLSGTR